MIRTTATLILTFFTLHLGLAQQQPGIPAITGISHVSFYADDIAKSESFYGTLLGWAMVRPAPSGMRGPDPGVRFYVNHEQYVELLPAPQPDLADRLNSVAFETRNAEGLRTYLAAHGITVPHAVSLETDGTQSFAVHDPEGNPVVFTETRHPQPQPKSTTQSLSSHIIHAGYPVHDRVALDHFYKDILGFHLYWQGGAKPRDVDWVMMQVPDGTDWIEYMLNLGPTPSRQQLGSANHIAPGVVSVADLQSRLEKRGWTPPDGKNPQVLGVDGKLQLDLHDPDGTRIEFMELLPSKTPCCSPYTGKQPAPSLAW